MVLQDFLHIILVWFVVTFGIFMKVGINYNILYQEGVNSSMKISFHDIVLPWSEARENFNFFVVVCILLVSVNLAYQTLKFLRNLKKYKQTRRFYEEVLEIGSDEIQNVTWTEVQNKIKENLQINELEFWQRVLRVKNFMISMVNNSLLPIKFDFPVIGENIFFTSGLRLNYELIFFNAPGAIFTDIEKMKLKCRSSAGMSEVQAELSNRIGLFGTLNFILIPFIFFWMLFHFFFENFALFRHHPQLMGSRTWSIYARHYLRHYNEPDHVFDARLNKGHRAGVRYMQQFASPILVAVAKFLIAVSGFILVVVFLNTLRDGDTLAVRGMIGCITVLGIIVAVAESLIPDENMIMMPETLMTCIARHIHYVQERWVERAHTNTVASEFGRLLPYKLVYLLCELLSFIFTPFILWFWLKPRSARIVEFFRTNSVCSGNLGNVCRPSRMGLGLMAMRRNQEEDEHEEDQQAKKMQQSLFQFSSRNPEWKADECQKMMISQHKLKARDFEKKNLDMFNLPLLPNSFDEEAEYASITMSEFDYKDDVASPKLEHASQTHQASTAINIEDEGEMSTMEQTYKPKDDAYDEEKQAAYIAYFQQRGSKTKS